MRTTIRINDQLLRDAKAQAARAGCSLTSLIEDSLRQTLSKQDDSKRRGWVELNTVSGHGLRPDVNLDDSANLLAILESTNGPD